MTLAPPPGAYDPLASAGRNDDPPAALRLRMASPVVGPEETEAIGAVLASGTLTNGPWTRRFEAAMAGRHGTEHGVAMANGTVALAAMLTAAGVGPGDEVIVPSLTFIATATSVLHVGATPVFADVAPDTLNLDPDDAARRVTARTRALVPVHYAGQPAEMDRLRALADAHRLLLFEDAAQAHGATFRGRSAGSWGDAAMFSFTPTKTITTGEGAVVTTDDGHLAQRLRLLRNHGLTAPYTHSVLGHNWRLSEVQAAMGVCQVARLDGLLATRRANAAHLAALLEPIVGVEPLVVRDEAQHPFMMFTVVLDDRHRRPALAAALTEAGIESRVYFPPAHRQAVFAGGAVPGLAVTDDMADRILSVPIHARVGDQDLRDVADVVAGVLSR